MSTVNVNVNAQGLNQVLAALVTLQGQMRAVGSAARSMQQQINAGAGGNPPPGGGGNRGSGNNNPPPAPNPAGGAQRAAAEAQALRDTARRDSSAIVAAYAEIASSVFALSAAFTLLNKSAQFGDMLLAQSSFAKATGTNMQSVAKELQNTTRYAINFQEAAQFASIGRLAGFTTKQVKDLAKIGTSAATILGRDVPDALSRMFRGVAKGEPEILDELGIFIRLDNAYKEYVKTVAKGQRVIDLTAAQRRQATYLAAKESAKAMAEGNADAKINDFTKAAANFTNALQSTMLVVTNTLGPAVLWLSNNMAAMTGLAVLMGSNILRNLSNILINQTKAAAAVEAAKNRLSSQKALATNLWGSAREQSRAIASQSTINSLQERARQAETAHQKATRTFLKEYQRAKSAEIQTQRAMGILTAQQAKDASAALKNQVGALRSSPNALNAAMVTSATATSPIGNSAAASAAARAALASAANASMALAAANQRTAASFGTISTAARVFGAAAIASFQVATAAAIRAVAVIQAGFTRLMGIASALLGPLGIGYALYSFGKMGLEAMGLLSKSMSDFEDSLEGVNTRLGEAFTKYDQLGRIDVTKFAEVSLDADKYANILDTTSTEITRIQEQLASGNIKQTWLDPGNITKAADQFKRISAVLGDMDKSKILSTAYTTLFNNARNKAESKATTATLGFGSTAGYQDIGKLTDEFKAKALANTASMEALEAAVRRGDITFKEYNDIMQRSAPILEDAAEGAKFYADAVKTAVNTVDLFKKSYNSLADTLRAESPFNESIISFRAMVKALEDGNKRANEIAANPGANRNAVLSAMNTQIGVLNQYREVTGQPILEAFLPEDSVTNTTKAIEKLNAETQKTVNILNSQQSSTETLRVSGIQAANNAAAHERILANMATRYKSIGIEVGNIVNLLTKSNKVAIESTISKETAAYLQEYEKLAATSSTEVAIADHRRTLAAKNKEAYDIIQEARLSMVNMSADIFNIPIELNVDGILTTLKPLSDAAIKRWGKDTTKRVFDNLAVSTYLKNIVANRSDYYSADFSGKDLTAKRDNLYQYNDTEKRKNLLAQLKVEVSNGTAAQSLYNDMLAEHNRLMEESNALTEEAWGREQAIFNGYDYGIDKLSLLSEAYASLGDESRSASREMQVYLQTLDVSTAKKVAELEAKIRSGAVEKAIKYAESNIKTLQGDTLPSGILTNDPQATAYRKAWEAKIALEKGDIANSIAGREQLAAANNELLMAEAALIEARKEAALQQANNGEATAEQINKIRSGVRKLADATIRFTALTNGLDNAIAAIFAGGDNPLGAAGDAISTELRGMAAKLSESQTKDGILLAKENIKKLYNKQDKDGNSIAKAFEGFKTDFKGLVGEKAFAGMEAAVPGLIMAATGRNDTERKQGAGNAIGSLLGAFGGPVGIAIGGVIGTVAGGYFSKKLKDTGIVATVSALGKVTANTLEVFKKGSFSGTKTIEQVGSSLEAEAIAAMQNAVASTRRSYETNILRMNALTDNLFNLTLGGLDKVFTSKFMQGGPDGQTSQEELLKDFAKSYGNFLGEGQLGFLQQFQDITESLTDTLARLVNSMVVADNTFKSAFGKGIGIIGDLSSQYINNFVATKGSELQTGFSNLFSDMRLALGGVPYYDQYGTRMDIGVTKNLEALLRKVVGTTPTGASSGTPNGYITFTQDMLTNSATISSTYFQAFANLFQSDFINKYVSTETLNILAKIEAYINGYGDKLEIMALATQAFTDRVIKAFEGNNIAEKTAAFNEAMAKYSNAVTSSIIVTANQVTSMIDKLKYVNGNNLPDGLVAVKGGLLVPIQEFNRSLKAAIESGASPEKIAEGIKLGTQLSEVITGILEVFSNISLSDATGAESFVKSVTEGLQSSFKSSAVDSFKKSLLAPLLLDVSNSIADAAIGGTSGFVSSMKDYAFSGDTVLNQAKNMVQVLNDPAFTAAMASVSVEFEKLMSVFNTASSSEITTKLTDNITDIIKSLKEAAYSFAVSGNEYSVALFKAREAFVSAGLSAGLAEQPIADTVAQVKLLATQGKISADNIELVNEALQSMADSATAARDEIVSVRDASSTVYNGANDFIKSLSLSVIDDSQSLDAAKVALEGLMTISADKLSSAKIAYDKAKSLGNALDYNNKADLFIQALEDNVNSQIDANTTLMNLAESKYQAEKAHLDNLTTIIKDVAAFIKEIKFDEQLSILKPIDRLNAAELNFNELKAKVLTEASAGTFDAEAIATLREDAKQLLTLGRDVYASGEQYTSLYNQVNSVMDSVKAKAGAEALTYEASTKLYQDMALSYAQQTRDLQLETVLQLKGIAQASAVDNAISVDLINALKYNQGLPQGLSLSDYYANLFTSAQSGGTVFTTPNTGYPQFENVGQYNTANTVQKDANAERLATVLANLTAVLANLPIDVKTAISSTNNLVTKRN